MKTINGFKELADDLQKLKLNEEKALHKASIPLINTAKQYAPRRTGRLRNSIQSEYKDNTLLIGIGPPVGTSITARGFYGRFQHDGFRAAGSRPVKQTYRKIPGTFYLHRALDAQIEHVLAIMEKEVLDIND